MSRCICCPHIMVGVELIRKDKKGKPELLCTHCLVEAGIFTPDTLEAADILPSDWEG